jgi:YfiH family protein
LNTIIIPEIFGSKITAFFTGKAVGIDREKISTALGISPDRIYLPIQKHTDKVIFLDLLHEPRLGDAVITRAKGVLIGVQVADCVPVLVYERGKEIISAVHAGWRGTAAGILKNTLEAMLGRYAGSPGSVLVAIGPAVGGCCYEVGPEVADAVERATGPGGYCTKKGDKYHLALASANRQQALSLGIPDENIWVSPECTSCSPDKFFSYRFSKGSTGRQGGFIGIL